MCRFPLVGLLLVVPLVAHGQTGNGSLRGYVRDFSGAVLPGVEVTATSSELIAPRAVSTDSLGYYRVLNLPPGEYSLVWSLTGFATHRRSSVVLRAGANFSVDVVLEIGSVEENVTVTAETPMLEVKKPSNVLNVDGDFQREMPIQARGYWSDFLELTPGVFAQPLPNNSGRMAYTGHGTTTDMHVLQLEGMIFSSYRHPLILMVGTSTETLNDVQVKTGGVDASSPLGTGLVINVMSRSGGNDLHGSVGYSYQPFEWNGDNAPTSGNVSGTATISRVSQIDASIGGPIARDKAWFFGTFRYSDLGNSINRTPEQVGLLESLSGIPLGGRGSIPPYEEFNNEIETLQPFIKVTGQLNPNHQLSGYYQADPVEFTLDQDYFYESINSYSSGGHFFGGKLTSVWGPSTTGQWTVSYNNKTRQDTLSESLSGPYIVVYDDYYESGGELNGSTRLVSGNSVNARTRSPASMWMIRGDLTHIMEGWGGSHELQTGIFLAPRNRWRSYTEYSNFDGDGWYYEGHRLLDIDNPSLGTVPFERVRRDVGSIQRRDARDRDIGIYFQDSWQPNPRLTLNLGLRVDFIRRFDGLNEFERMNTTVFGPRVGFSYLLTGDARNVLRGSYGRVHEAVAGSDAATSYDGSAGDSGGRSTQIVEYDREGDGVWEQQEVYPATAGMLDPALEFDPDLTQPFVDEYILGFRKQFPGQIAVDVAGIHRRYRKIYALVDINGIYPGEPYQPFAGFGSVDPNRGIIYQQTNIDWSELVYTALEITVTKRLSHRFQATAGFNRQWQLISGDWNPTDPARFIQPDHFPNDKALPMSWGNNDENSLRSSTDNSMGLIWRPYSLHFGGTYLAPAGVVVAASYTHMAGLWNGPLLDRLSRSDPDVKQYGPPRFPLADGRTAANPLSTVFRFAGDDRSDGQIRTPDVKSFGLKIGKRFSLGGRGELELAGSVFNLFNWGNHYDYNYVFSNKVYSPRYAEMRNLQPARAFQLSVTFRY